MPEEMPWPLDQSALHLAIDMQLLFAEPGPWCVPWMPRILPNVALIAERHPERTVFTRFIPPRDPFGLPGAWQDYYRHWHAMTRESLDVRLLELVPPLGRLVPPATLCDKAVHSAFANPTLLPWLLARGIRTLIVTGGETDVCVLATVMAAMDHGFRIGLVTDALCSGSNETHDALMTLYGKRFQHHIATVTTEQVLETWQ